MNDRHFSIGRKESPELREMLAEIVHSGEGRTLIVSGEAGSGKTFLIKEFLSESYESYERKLVSGYGYSVNLSGSIRSYHPWKEAIIDIDTNLLVMNYLHGLPRKGVDYKKVIKSAFEGTGVDWIKAIPQIGNISSLIYKTVKEIQEGVSEQKIAKAIKKISEGITFNNAESLFEAISAKLRNITEKYPLIIFIDDLQWMDQSSRELFFYLAKNLNDVPYKLLLIGAYRTEELFKRTGDTESGTFTDLNGLIVNLKKFTNTGFLEIGKLTKEEVIDYLFKRFPDNRFKSDLGDSLFQTSGGNILILDQLLDNYESSGVINKEGNVFLCQDFQGIDNLPSSINDLFAEKWNRLPDDLQEILRIASVMGDNFSVEIVTALLGENQLKLFKKIEVLKNVHKIITDSAIEYGKLRKVFKFVHTLFERFVYDTIDEQFRSEYHKLIAEEIKKNFKNLDDESILPRYIFHFGIGENIQNDHNEVILTKEQLDDESFRSKLKEYEAKLEILTEKNSKGYSSEEALRNLAILCSLSQIAEDNMLFARRRNLAGKILTIAGKPAEAEKAFLESFTIAEKSGNTDLLAECYVNIGNLMLRRTELDESREKLKKALELYRASGNREGRAIVLLNLAELEMKRGRLDDAFAFAQESLQQRESDSKDKGIATNYLLLGNVLNQKGELSEAGEYYLKALKVAQDQADNQLQSLLNSVHATLDIKRGEFDSALEKLSSSFEIQKKSYDMRALAIVKNNMALIYQFKGEYSKARELYDEAYVSFKNISDKRSTADTLYNISDLEIFRGDLAEAERAVDNALVIARETELDNLMMKLLDHKARIRLHLKDFKVAESILDESDMYSESGGKIETYRYKLARAILLSNKSSEEALKMMRDLRSNCPDEELSAEIAYEMCLITKEAEDISYALGKYESLFDRLKRYNYKTTSEKLSSMLE